MISKIKKYTFIPVLLVLLLFPGCKKFLEKDPQGLLTQEAFPETATDALQATNACYESVREWFYNSGGYPILDIMSDDARKGSNVNDQSSTVGPYDYFAITPTQDGLDRWWSALYVGVKYCNVVIEKVAVITSMNSDTKNRYIAEAKFIRGLIYFDFLRAWGGVPIVTTTTPPLKLARATTDEMYALIIDDLNFAAENLPQKYTGSDIGRATSGAAKSMLARVFLFRRDVSKNDFVNAANNAMDVINSGVYHLETNYIDANGVNGQNGPESVFEVGALQADGTDNGGNQYANTQGVRGNPNRGWGFNRPTIDLRNSFEAGDPRIKGTIIDLGDVIDGDTIQGDPGTPDVTKDGQGNIIEVECYTRKVWVPGIDVATQWGHHRRLIRYADVLLMAAEALNENNQPGDALIYLNMVRFRARQGNNNILPDITTTDQTQLRDIIINERRHELAMEGWRFWDLIRTGKAVQVLGPLGFTAGKNELLPIPQSEIDISQGVLIQNPNY